MRIGTANICNYPDMPKAKVQADAREIAALTDTWGQQENNPAEDDEAISKALGPSWMVVHGDTNVPIWYRTGRLELTGQRKVQADFTPPLPLTPRPRWITAATFGVIGRPGVERFALVNCHLIAGGYNGPESEARARQWRVEFKALRNLVESYKARDLTVFVAGDFNHPRPPKPTTDFVWLVGARLDRIGVTTTGGTKARETDDGVVELHSDHHGQWTKVALS